MTDNIREVALDVLLRVEREEEISFDRQLKKTLAHLDALPGMEKTFLVTLSQGTYRNRILLDAVLNRYSKHPANKMKPLIRCLMRMGVYQILFLDEVPDAAACNEAVKLAGKRGFQSLKGFVNGVLRTVARERETILTDLKSVPLSVRCSMPEEVCSHLEESYGEERAAEICEAFLQPRPVSIRLRKEAMVRDEVTEDMLFQRMQATAEGIVIRPHAVVPDVYVLTHGGNVQKLYGYHEGYFIVQDAAGVLAVQLAGVKAGDTVIDVCASPGGKAACAADFCTGTGRVIARDVSEEKLKRLNENIKRLGLAQVTAEVADARERDARLLETADVLICDLPCSALGIIGRKPEVKYRFRKEEAQVLVELQREILQAVWTYVKPGGTLLYSTCTLNPAENEAQVEWIRENLPFAPVDLRARVPEALSETESLRDGYLQLYPTDFDTDGFFIAVLKRREDV